MTTVRTTNRWRGMAGVALVAGAVGLVGNRPTILLSAAVLVGFALYPRLQGGPPVELAVERRLDEANPDPGDEVTVTVRVTNRSDRRLWDLRLVDGVPALLSVADGSPRHACSLPAEESATFSYVVRAERGAHRFRPLTAIGRNLAGSVEVERQIAPDGDAVACRDPVADPPVGDDTDPYPGRVLTEDAGEGVEFARLREYRPGDAPTRIDWKRLARMGSLATVEFRREQTVSVVACVDARPPAYVGQPGRPHAVSDSKAAARALIESVWDIDERAGLAAIGREFAWLAPDRGSDQAARLDRLLGTHAALSPHPPSEPLGREAVDQQLRELRARLGANTQVVFLTPLADAVPVDATLELSATGRAIAVVSPDVTTTDSLGDRVAAVERANRIKRLREAGVRVIDWDPSTPLARALVGAAQRWSR